MKYITTPADAGKRLDILLTEVSPINCGRNAFKALIRKGEVKSSKKTIYKPSYILSESEHIIFPLPQKADQALPQPESIPLDVLFENEHVLVVSKPPGMCTHPDAHHHSGTLVNAIMGYLADHQKEFDHEPIRPGIVHRLDKDTSGCIMVAKTQEMHGFLSAQIAERKIEKKYMALVSGRLPALHGTIDSPLDRDPHNREKRKAIQTHTSKPAITHFWVQDEFLSPTTTLAQVQIITGRTHQIRVHFASIGHPVVGDDLYGDETQNKEYAKFLGTERMFLHASSLSFPPFPNAPKTLTVQSPFPTELKNAFGRYPQK